MNNTQFVELENEYFNITKKIYRELYNNLLDKFAYYKYGRQYDVMILKSCIEITSNKKIFRVYISNNVSKPCYILEVFDNLEEITVEREVIKKYNNIINFTSLYKIILEELEGA